MKKSTGVRLYLTYYEAVAVESILETVYNRNDCYGEYEREAHLKLKAGIAKVSMYAELYRKLAVDMAKIDAEQTAGSQVIPAVTEISGASSKDKPVVISTTELFTKMNPRAKGTTLVKRETEADWKFERRVLKEQIKETNPEATAEEVFAEAIRIIGPVSE